MCLHGSTHLFILSLLLQLVQPDEEFSFQQFLNPANKYKNRYANIVACRLFFTHFLHDFELFLLLLLLLLLLFLLSVGSRNVKLYPSFVDDHTRVLLNPIDGVPGSDYINANFLDVSFADLN